MKLSQLQMLVAVADHGSFSAAAAELDCTQSRISHAIAELERELGTRLLARSHGGSLPTEAGLRVLDKARQMLRLEDSLRACARTDDAIEGRVRVACFRSIGTHLLPYAAEALAARHPGLVLDIDDACNDRLEVIDALRAGRADVGIAQLPVEDGFIVHPYVADDYMLVVPAARRFDAPVTWDQLDGLPFIRLGCSGADAILARCRAAGLVASAERTLSNDTSIAAMVARGMGWSILPRLATFPEGDEVQVLPLPIPARRQFALAGPRTAMASRAVKAVLGVLRDRRLLAATRAGQAGILYWP
ncbi:LysR family transcriptional regulator [Massilia putida]|uniref:LysR family transcriptional regulator n=1 Tax=Massilia putida TaxID=1141883 RepID=UPI001E4A9E52|nr:LysR family transcriptional regulator [Massilia putida]